MIKEAKLPAMQAMQSVPPLVENGVKSPEQLSAFDPAALKVVPGSSQ